MHGKRVWIWWIVFIKFLNHFQKMRIIFTALIKEEAEGGYSVLCPELGVASQGVKAKKLKSSAEKFKYSENQFYTEETK